MAVSGEVLRSRLLGRRAAALLCLVGLAAMCASLDRVRMFEAHASAFVAALILPVPVDGVPGRPELVINPGAQPGFILVVTGECTAGLLLAALLLGTAVAFWSLDRFSVARVAAALSAAAIVFVVVNQSRLVMMAALMRLWDIDQGYLIGHHLVGSLFTFAGSVIALLSFVLILSGSASRARGLRSLSPRKQQCP